MFYSIVTNDGCLFVGSFAKNALSVRNRACNELTGCVECRNEWKNTKNIVNLFGGRFSEMPHRITLL
jgi:hypothetical protein